MSHYKPQLGGVNCANFVNGECISHLANGERWQDYYNQNVIACPFELEFGTKIEIQGVMYECKDRGGAIIADGETYWVDILGDSIAPYGTIMEAKLYK